MLLSRKIATKFLQYAGTSARFRCLEQNKCLVLTKNFHVSQNYCEVVPFVLSDIGEGIREVSVKEWFIKVGDKVAQFDEICEVQSDKASVTITSRYDGIIKKLHYKIDDTALVGKPLVDIETEDVAATKFPENANVSTETRTEDEIPITISVDKTEVLCIPSVRRLAKQYNVDLSQIKGTGKGNRVLKEDVLKYLSINNEQDVANSSQKAAGTNLLDRVEPIKGFQKAMVKTMTDSLKIPHLVFSDEIKVTKLSQLRKMLKTDAEYQDLKLSFMPFFIKAASNALQRYPVLNATVDENCENVTYKAQHNIGVAMDTKVGLAVPNIKNVEKLSIIEINNELNRIIKSGRSGSFSTEDLAGGTFTLSNIGAIGGTYMKPVIMPPQVALLALGVSQVLPRFDSFNSVVAEEIINLSAAADHRIVDGATMARFAQVFKKQVENPHLLFLNL